MATPVVFNGVSYSVPAFGDVGYAQGPGNLSSYLIALASGTLQATGGLFSLTSQANFGPNFGLTALDFTSVTALPATAGVLRLAKTDVIDWRNNANTLNLPLGINGTDQLTFNGAVVGLAGGFVTSVSGTTNQINSTGGTTPILSLSSTLIVPGTFTIPAVTNQIVLGTTNTITLNSPAPAGSLVYTIPDVAGAASFVMTLGNQTISGVKTFNSQILVTGGAGGLTLSASTIAMGGNKITGLANGTAATDAAALGQLKVLQNVFATAASSSSLTSATFTATVVTGSITPTSASSRVKITAMFMSYIPVAAGTGQYYIARGTTKLGTGNAMAEQGDQGVSFTVGVITLSWIDSPATTSATSYTVYGSNTNAVGTITVGNGRDWSMVLEEIV